MKIYARYILITALIVCTLISVRSQQDIHEGSGRINELEKMLAGHKADTGKVKLLNDIAYEYNKVSPYDGIKYARQSISLAEKLHYETGIARANSCLGANYYSLSDFPNAYKYWLIALDINEKMGNKIGIANHLHNIGNIYFSQKNYPLALEYYEKGLKSSEEIGNKKLLTNSYTSIGNVYTGLKDYDKALQYHFNALDIDDKSGLKGNVAADEINIGSIYDCQHNYSRALEILSRAVQIKKDIGDKNGVANAYNLTGKIFLDIAEDTSVNSKEPDSARHALQNAVVYLDSAIAVDKEIGYMDNMQKSYGYLSDVQELLNDDKAALNTYKEYNVIKDSIFSMGKQTEIFNLEKKEEIEEANRQLEKAEEEREHTEYIQIGGVCCFITILVFVLLILRRRKVSPQLIDILCTFSVLIFFEFINLLLHGQIEKLTDHNLILTLLCLLVVAAIVIPIHHKLEHWMKKKVGQKSHHPIIEDIVIAAETTEPLDT